jgi:hypothetical protein
LSNSPATAEIVDQIEKICVIEAQKLVNLGYAQQALTSVVLGLEWFGGVLDGMPHGAKKQSRKRFELTLSHLPKSYLALHLKVDLYKQLRNRVIHNPWTKSKHMKLTQENEDSRTSHISNHELDLQNLILDFSGLINDFRKKEN